MGGRGWEGDRRWEGKGKRGEKTEVSRSWVGKERGARERDEESEVRRTRGGGKHGGR